jgi:hypothetical protein
VTLWASHILQNSPQFIVQGVEVWTPWWPSSALIKARTFLHSCSRVVLALWARAESCWKTHFWPVKTVVLRGFTTPCKHILLMHSGTSFHTFLAELSPPNGAPPHQTMMQEGWWPPAPSKRISRDVWA